jgi:hypothetical protein
VYVGLGLERHISTLRVGCKSQTLTVQWQMFDTLAEQFHLIIWLKQKKIYLTKKATRYFLVNTRITTIFILEMFIQEFVDPWWFDYLY